MHIKETKLYHYDELSDDANEYQNSDEQVTDTIVANEYEFTADGNRA